MMTRMWVTHTLLVIGHLLWASSKAKCTVTTQSSYCILGPLFQRNEVLLSHKNLYMYVHKSLFVIEAGTSPDDFQQANG